MAKPTSSKSSKPLNPTPLKSILKKTGSSIGAPAQHTQSSRKGKRAWRKNVNIEDVEKGMEEIRSEERVTGTALHKMKDSELFQVDVTGDDKIRHILPRFSSSQLTSAKILAQRSAVPAVVSRTTSSHKRKAALSREEKERLLRIAKRPRKGPFNSVMDPSEIPSGGTIVDLSDAVKKSGDYDPWVSEPEVQLKDGMETVQAKKFRPPAVTKDRDLIEIPAIVEPHQGTSYNPPVEAHQELLLKAHEVEEKRIKEVEKNAAVKKKMEGAVQEVNENDWMTAPGMKVAEVVEDDDEEKEGQEEDDKPERKMVERKTKSQKKKAAKVLAEKRALADRAARKKLLASIEQARGLRKANAQSTSERESLQLLRRLALQDKLKKQGLTGQRLGRHKVPESEVEVQLGEDLSESLRGLKPEGNLFRDRFKSLQQRALVEPRVPVVPKRHKHRIIEYEKHAWKRFE